MIDPDLDALQALIDAQRKNGSPVLLHADLADALIDRLRKAEAASKWQPIETAPMDGTEILLLATRYSMLQQKQERLVGSYDRGWWAGNIPLSHVKLWQPLPAAPTADSEGAKG